MSHVFPSHNDLEKEYAWIDGGLEIRDYIAIQAMKELMRAAGLDPAISMKSIAEDAYTMADLMIAARCANV